MAENIDDDKRKQFGNRLLTDPRNVFEHNAWDNVVWDETQELEAKSKTREQLKHMADEQDIEKFESEANLFWDQFYGKHENKFFKDRHWLFTEFPELAPESYLPSEKLSQLKVNVGPESKGGNINTNSTELLDKNKAFGESKGDNVNTNSTELLDKNKTFGESKGDNVSTNSTELFNTDTAFGTDVKESEQGSRCDSLQSTDVTKENDEDVDKRENYPGEYSKYRMLEVGCGVGNTVFPILQANNDPHLMLYCCDYSKTAIQLVEENVDYNKRRCHAFVCDISDPESTVPFPDGSLDVIILIFILSANNPEKFQYILNRLAAFLKPGGIILFRDYGRYDLAQLRFKKGKCLGENFYVRGDGTRVYFFTQEELREMMTKAGLIEKQNLVDRRLQVNRGKQLKMYRVWIQCKYQKPDDKLCDQNKR